MCILVLETHTSIYSNWVQPIASSHDLERQDWVGNRGTPRAVYIGSYTRETTLTADNSTSNRQTYESKNRTDHFQPNVAEAFESKNNIAVLLTRGMRRTYLCIYMY